MSKAKSKAKRLPPPVLVASEASIQRGTSGAYGHMHGGHDAPKSCKDGTRLVHVSFTSQVRCYCVAQVRRYCVRKRPRGFLTGAALQKQHNSAGRRTGIGAGCDSRAMGIGTERASSAARRETKDDQVRERKRELAVQHKTIDEQHQQRVQQLKEQVAAMRAQQQALAAKAQTEERAKTVELEQALERSRQRLQELSRQVQEADTAAATALEKTEASNSKTPAAADQLLHCLGDSHGFCPIAPAPFVWTVKQQQDHASHFGAAAPPPPLTAASSGTTASSGTSTPHSAPEGG